MKFDIRNSLTGDVQFTAEIDCADDAPHGVKVGLAARTAFSAGVNLRRADFRRRRMDAKNVST